MMNESVFMRAKSLFVEANIRRYSPVCGKHRLALTFVLDA